MKSARYFFATLSSISAVPCAATYFTAGEKEVRAWTARTGATAPKAAGVIHTDFDLPKMTTWGTGLLVVGPPVLACGLWMSFSPFWS